MPISASGVFVCYSLCTGREGQLLVLLVRVSVGLDDVLAEMGINEGFYERGDSFVNCRYETTKL